MKIKLPFRGRFKDPMLSGIKTMTCRPTKYGSPGDTFEAFDATFLITHVMRMQLGHVMSDCFAQEGCKSPKEFFAIWVAIHMVKGFDSGQIVWAHCFVMDFVVQAQNSGSRVESRNRKP